MAKKDELTTDQQLDLLKHGTTETIKLLSKSKLAMAVAILISLHIASGIIPAGKGHLTFIKVLQGLTMAGYIGSELEGETQIAAVESILIATGVYAGLGLGFEGEAPGKEYKAGPWHPIYGLTPWFDEQLGL